MVTATYKIIENHIYVFFSSRPDNKTIEILKLRYARFMTNVQGKKAWRLVNNNENLMFVKSLIKSMNPVPIPPPDRLDFLPKKTVGLTDVLIRGNSFQCKNHHVQEFAGVVPILTRIGTIENHVISLWYCFDCQYYFVLNQTFQELKAKGVILCRVVDYKTFHDYHPSYNIPRFKWNQVSPLRLCGYCVNQNENLSDEQRHAILEFIVDKGILSKQTVMSYLVFFINNLNSGQTALEKWTSDYNYISVYKLHSAQRKVIQGFFKL